MSKNPPGQTPGSRLIRVNTGSPMGALQCTRTGAPRTLPSVRKPPEKASLRSGFRTREGSPRSVVRDGDSGLARIEEAAQVVHHGVARLELPHLVEEVVLEEAHDGRVLHRQ